MEFLLLMTVLILVLYYALLVMLDRRLRTSIRRRLENPEYMRRWTLVKERADTGD